jgi:predicted Co/Zn/Cd cation transporter (cation efflux family)
MFLLPLLVVWALLLTLANGALLARKLFSPSSVWRKVLLGTAGLLFGLFVWSVSIIFTTDSLW